MKELLWTRVTAVWVLMVLATIASWAMGHGMGLSDPTMAGVSIIVIAMIKFRLVLFDFMELHGAPAGMRRFGDLWTLGLGALLITLLVI